jgi:hypothetical protein
MVLLQQHYIRHEVVMVHVDLQVLGNFIEPVSCGILGICHDSDHLTDLAFEIYPNGHHRLTVFGLFTLNGDVHEEIGDSHEGRGMLEQLAVISVSLYVGKTHVVGDDQMVSLKNITGFSNEDLRQFFIALHDSSQLLVVAFKDVVCLPKTLDTMVIQLFVCQAQRRRLDHGS